MSDFMERVETNLGKRMNNIQPIFRLSYGFTVVFLENEKEAIEKQVFSRSYVGIIM